MALPLLGEIWLKYQVANFSRMLSTLLAGGMPLVPSLETAGASMSSRSILNGIPRPQPGFVKVKRWPRAWKSRRCFPDLSVEMIEVGESTGALPAMLNSVAEFYEEDVQTALGAAMALIEPVILIIHGGVRGRGVDFAVSADLHPGIEYSLEPELADSQGPGRRCGYGGNGGKETNLSGGNGG